MTSYYVDSNAANDSGSGAIGSPWQKLSTHVGTPVAGDTIFLRGGASAGARQTYNDYVLVSSTNAANGTAGNVITITPYNNEFVLLTSPSGNPPLRFNNRSYWTVNGLDSDYHIKIDCQDRTSGGMGVALAAAAHHITLRYLEVTNGAYDGLIDLEAGSHDNIVEYCKIYDNLRLGTDVHGILVDGSTAVPSYSNIYRYNTIYNCRGDSIQWQATSGQVGAFADEECYGNECYAEAAVAAGCENGLDIKSGAGFLIHDNTFHGFRWCDGTTGGTTSHGEAITIHNDVTTIQIYDNTIYDISGPALAASDEAVVVEFYRNLIYDLAYEAITGGRRYVFYIVTNAHVKAYNNTIVGDYANNGGLFRLVNTASTITLRNNIFYDTGEITKVAGSAVTAADHNCWYLAEASESGTGDVTTDPSFVNLAADDYTITTGSPCYETGTTTGLPAGLSYFGSVPDMGYYEVAAASASLSPSASASASPSRSASASPSRSLSPSASRSTSLSPSASQSPSTSTSPSASVSRSASASPSASASVSPSASQSPSASASRSASRSASPSASGSASVSASISPSASAAVAVPLAGDTTVGVSDYRLIIRAATGTKVADISDHLAVAYTKRVNAAGQFMFQLAGGHAAIAQLTDKCQIEVWRRNLSLGVDWYADFHGLYRARASRYTDHDVFTGRGPGVLGLLDWRRIAYPAGVTGRSDFAAVPGETVMKTLVTYNATAAGTTVDGRHKAATSGGAVNGYTITVQTDGAGGTALSLGCANAGLLETLQKVARVAGGDFDLVRTGALAFEFRWYAGQRGNDRTATLVFALERGNMARPEYAYDRRDERTSVIVGGQGEGADRVYVVRLGADYNLATNDIETFVNAADMETTAGMNTRGDQRADALRAVQAFTFDVLQTPASAYGLHYNLGDLAHARYLDASATVKIAAVTVSSDADQVESITPELESVA
jgi:hypothetical protein